MKFIVIAFCSLSYFFVAPLHAQQFNSLSGQYGCVLNRNFGGYNVANIQSTVDENITGSNFLMFLDFTNNKVEVNAVGLKTWGVAKIITGSIAITNGYISVTKGPIANTFKVTATMTTNGQSFTTIYNLMPVNGGATLLLQSALTGSGDGEPTTGACNKV